MTDTAAAKKIENLIADYTSCNGNIGFSHRDRSLRLELYNGVGVNFAEAVEFKNGKRYPVALADFFDALRAAIAVFEIIDAKRVRDDVKSLQKEPKRTFAGQREHDAEIDAENEERWSTRTLDGKVGSIGFSLKWGATGEHEIFHGYLLETKDDAMRFRLANVSDW